MENFPGFLKYDAKHWANGLAMIKGLTNEFKNLKIFRGQFPFPFGKCVYWTRRDTLLIRTYSRPYRAVGRSENIVGEGK